MIKMLYIFQNQFNNWKWIAKGDNLKSWRICIDFNVWIYAFIYLSTLKCRIPNQIPDGHDIMSRLRFWLDIYVVHYAGTCQNNSSHNSNIEDKLHCKKQLKSDGWKFQSSKSIELHYIVISSRSIITEYNNKPWLYNHFESYEGWLHLHLYNLFISRWSCFAYLHTNSARAPSSQSFWNICMT